MSTKFFPKNKDVNITTTIVVEDDVYTKIRALSKECGTSISDFVRQAIEYTSSDEKFMDNIEGSKKSYPISIRVPNSIHNRVKKICAEYGATRYSVYQQMICHAIENIEK